MESNTDLKHFLISVSAHLTLFLFLTVKIVFFPAERPEFVRAVRVDLVALPDKNPKEGPVGVEKPPAEKVEAKKSEPKPKEPAPAPEKTAAKEALKPKKETPDKKSSENKKTDTKAEQNSALKRLEALNKIRKMKEAKGPEGTTYKGNQISEGNSLTGVDKLQHDTYLGDLDAHIKQNWQLPEWLAKKNLTAAVLVRFDQNGAILERKLLRSSGDGSFDGQALQAINASAPFPAPPENLVSYFKVQGIELRFPE